LEAHQNASQRVQGIRDILTWQPDKKILNGAKTDNKMSDPIWREGFAQLSEFDLSFEATIYDNQIEDLNDLARAYPDQRIMLCHAATPIAIGGPFGGKGNSEQERDKIFKNWKERLSKLAENQNVWIKISGLAMPVCGFGFAHRKADSNEVADFLNPLVQHLISVFGIERCVFGSNFPIEKVSLSYELLIDSFQKIMSDYSIEDQSAFFNSNAKNFYKIT
jgi:predicted TIM-barrel fold metal-dependent hydrolase